VVCVVQWCVLSSGVCCPVVCVVQWCVLSSGVCCAVVCVVQWCVLCSCVHKLWHCKEFKAKLLKERNDFVWSQTLCFRCLQSRHLSRECRSNLRCKICGEMSHNTLLHRDNNFSNVRSENKKMTKQVSRLLWLVGLTNNLSKEPNCIKWFQKKCGQQTQQITS